MTTTTISQFDNSDYDALWDGRGISLCTNPMGISPMTLNYELSDWLIMTLIFVFVFTFLCLFVYNPNGLKY